jgi:flap endonuclease-1
MPVVEVHHSKILGGLEFTEDQFIDLCILLGCDYCDSIAGIGPKTAIKLVAEYKCIEKVIEHIVTSKKYTIPEDWQFERVC